MPEMLLPRQWGLQQLLQQVHLHVHLGRAAAEAAAAAATPADPAVAVTPDARQWHVHCCTACSTARHPHLGPGRHPLCAAAELGPVIVNGKLAGAVAATPASKGAVSLSKAGAGWAANCP